MFKRNKIIVVCVLLFLVIVFNNLFVKPNQISNKANIILKLKEKGYKKTEISVFQTISFDWDESIINIFIMDKKLDVDFKKGKGGNDYNKKIKKSLKRRMKNIDDAICFENADTLFDIFAIKKQRNIAKELNQYEQLYYSQGFNIREIHNTIRWYKKKGDNNVYFCCLNNTAIITGMTTKKSINNINDLIIEISSVLTESK